VSDNDQVVVVDNHQLASVRLEDQVLGHDLDDGYHHVDSGQYSLHHVPTGGKLDSSDIASSL